MINLSVGYSAGITLKVIGNQWWWQYEYGDLVTDDLDVTTIESHMVEAEHLRSRGLLDLSYLAVDESVKLPCFTHIRFLITSTDVLHCWTLPSLGIKMDAVPGRLNQSTGFIKKLGVYFGQCSS